MNNKIEKMNAMTFMGNCGNGLNIYIQQCESRYFPEEFHVIQQAMMRVNGGCCYKGVPFRVMELDSSLENRIIDVLNCSLVLFKYVLVQTTLYTDSILPRIILLVDYTHNSPNNSQLRIPCVIDEKAVYAVKAYLRKYLSEHNDINKEYSSREWSYFNYGVHFATVSVADHCETVLTKLLQHLYHGSDFDVFGTNMNATTLYTNEDPYRCDHDWRFGLVDISEDLLKKNGEDCELGILQEECAELIQAVSKYKRKKIECTKDASLKNVPAVDYLDIPKKEIAYEMADVLSIMETCCNILKINGLEIEIDKAYKIVRQGRRLYRRKPISEIHELEHLEP